MEPTNQPQPLPEKAPETSQEAPAPQLDQAPAAPAATPPPSQPVATPPPQPVAQSPAVAPVPAPSNTPATADDVDVIEKEWVDAAQEVVKGNAEDPHGEEEGFENLQVDYLKKRYGKDIKKPQE